MGRYIDWADVINRYPEMETMDDATDTASIYISYAEAFVDGSLASHYAVPFSSNNILVADISADVVFARMNRVSAERITEVMSSAFGRLEMLREGSLTMVDAAGVVIPQLVRNAAIWSSTSSYAPTFGVRDPIEWEVSEGRLSDELFGSGE